MSKELDTYSRADGNLNIDDYISQFLDLSILKEPIAKSNQNSIVIESENSSLEEYTSQEASSAFQIEESDEAHIKRSPLHNFQKHFVTTIRQNVKIDWASLKGVHIQAARQIWEIFNSTQKYTKQFVSLVLGQNKDIVDEKHLRKYGLLNCYNKYGEQIYILAQCELKNHVIRAFQNISRETIMSSRRIAKKEEFANYFFKVLAEIEQGMMHKRLPKKRLPRRKTQRN